MLKIDGPIFIHSVDNNILVGDGVDQIQLPLAAFQAMGPTEAAYTLEPPYVWQIYTQGVSWYKHTLDTAYQQEIPYPDGDYFISRVSHYLANYPPPPTLDEAKAARKIDAQNYFQTIIDGGIDYSGSFPNPFPSLPYSTNALIDYIQAGNVPVGFQLLDMDDEYQSVNLTQLLNINSGVVALNYASDINLESIFEAIDSCTTLEQVADVDITDGYPTVPYVITSMKNETNSVAKESC